MKAKNLEKVVIINSFEAAVPFFLPFICFCIFFDFYLLFLWARGDWCMTATAISLSCTFLA